MRAWSCNSKPRIGLRLELHERLDTVGCFRDLLSCDGRLGLEGVGEVGEGTVGGQAAFCRAIPLSWAWWCIRRCCATSRQTLRDIRSNEQVPGYCPFFL